MMDVIIASAVTASIPTFLLFLQASQPNCLYGSGMIAAIATFEPGGILVGMGCLLLAQMLAIQLTMAGIRLYYVRWVFRKCYASSKETGEAVESISSLPLSHYLQKKIRRGIVLQYMRGVWARREARLKNEKCLHEEPPVSNKESDTGESYHG